MGLLHVAGIFQLQPEGCLADGGSNAAGRLVFLISTEI